MLIGIDIGDNDFSVTMRGFLRIFIESNVAELKPELVTKARLLQIWKMTAPGIYWTQNAWRYTNGATEADHQSHTAKYLTEIGEERFFVGQECLDRFVKDNNCEFHYIDTDTGQIWTS
jgi:hypothetical protein